MLHYVVLQQADICLSSNFAILVFKINKTLSLLSTIFIVSSVVVTHRLEPS